MSFARTRMFLGLVLMAPLATSPVAAQTVSAEQPRTIVAMLKARGLPADITAQEDGTPFIRSAHDAMPFVVGMMNCNDRKSACKTVQFYFGFSDRKGVSLEQLNRWNSTKRFVRAYRDSEGDPVLVMDVDTDLGGVPEAIFNENLDVWLNQMQAFRRFVNEDAGGS